MKPRELLCLAVGYGSALVRACGGHSHEVREWSQEELDDLEKKWGHEVSNDIPNSYNLNMIWVTIVAYEVDRSRSCHL